MTDTPHSVEQLWTRVAPGAPPAQREALELVAGEGVRGDHKLGAKRHVTLVFRVDWEAGTAELGTGVDPKERRANVLLSGGGGGAWIGKRMRLGDVVLDVQGETHPCSMLDDAAPGLLDALRPDCRAGVWATVVEGGTLRPGTAAVAC